MFDRAYSLPAQMDGPMLVGLTRHVAEQKPRKPMKGSSDEGSQARAHKLRKLTFTRRRPGGKQVNSGKERVQRNSERACVLTGAHGGE